MYDHYEEPWKTSECRTIKTSKKKFPNEAARLLHITQEIALFGDEHSVEAAYIEDVYAGFSVKQLARLRGALDVQVWSINHIEIVPINVSQARRLLLGPAKKYDRKQIKKIVLDIWQAAGAPVTDDAQADAMTIANYALHLRGKQCLTK